MKYKCEILDMCKDSGITQEQCDKYNDCAVCKYLRTVLDKQNNIELKQENDKKAVKK